MELIPQVISKITSAKNVLIIVAGNNGDSLAAGLALQGFLKKLEKETQVLSYTPKFQNLDFLPGFSQVKEEFDAVKSFVIDVSTKQVEIDELSYKKEAEQLSIFIKPKKGQFSQTDVTFRSSNFPFDLVILVGIDSLDRLGEIYSQNTELFFETTLLNIDFRISNENYAQLNLVQLAATSNSEIVFDLINQLEASFIDENIATQLLAGIVVETDSFQHVRTTPQTFLKASQLVGLGANQQEIISRLYKSKSLGLLKLWGRVLSKLQQESSISLVYSAVTQVDLEQAQATDQDAGHIIKEMASQLGFAKLFLFLKENSTGFTTCYLHASMPLELIKIFARFEPKAVGQQTIKFDTNFPLIEAEKQIVQLLVSEISKYKTAA
ncbi:MAG TPA: DHH family phosphoesterase [Methylomirabilota bacterium]|jgi:nanoRNase/pAp phosphatase (c-di-AMP/oligoRNAs hydrolase)|nr:DHH family phosphoesterase [Methylomirabilota bacterium]